MKDQKNREIKSLEGEVRLLEESRKAHRPGEIVRAGRSNEGEDRPQILEGKG